MNEMTPPQKMTAKDWETDQEVRWCPGCGDYAILKAMQRTLPEIGARPENTVFVSGIGCSSRFPYYLDTYGMHSIHGRAPAIASGLLVIRAVFVLQHPERVIREDSLNHSLGVLGSMAWLFFSVGMSLALAAVVLYKLQRKLSQAATHDALTGLPNRRAADDFMAHEALLAQRRGSSLSALMVDIDFFKKVNDQYGHAAGDHVLQTLAQLLKRRARASDLVARWGGDEFLVAGLGHKPDAQTLAKRIEDAVQRTGINLGRWPTTVKVGTAAGDPREATFDGLVALAIAEADATGGGAATAGCPGGSERGGGPPPRVRQ